jgi:hypothetical protein
LVQAINAATTVSVGVGPMFVPSRSLGSSMTVLTSPHTAISVRESGSYHEYVASVAFFSLTTTMTSFLLCIDRRLSDGHIDLNCLIGR